MKRSAADEQLHAQYLANKIVALGGEPTTEPRPVPEAATNRAMLKAVLEAERLRSSLRGHPVPVAQAGRGHLNFAENPVG